MSILKNKDIGDASSQCKKYISYILQCYLDTTAICTSISESELNLLAKYIFTYRILTWCGWCIGHKTTSINKIFNENVQKNKYLNSVLCHCKLSLMFGRYDHDKPVLHDQASSGHWDSDVWGCSRRFGSDPSSSVPHRNIGLEAEPADLLRSHDPVHYGRVHLPAPQSKRYLTSQGHMLRRLYGLCHCTRAKLFSTAEWLGTHIQ